MSKIKLTLTNDYMLSFVHPYDHMLDFCMSMIHDLFPGLDYSTADIDLYISDVRPAGKNYYMVKPSWRHSDNYINIYQPDGALVEADVYLLKSTVMALTRLFDDTKGFPKFGRRKSVWYVWVRA